ncbi:MAG: hypothetical protein CVV42_19825 [Candidatus Riflebacteria bacterium HGW-Riflebacteria-2]|jgi:hypothetical protein|nr:MAG: hypothetical protein CVV42_19825 [Candidatus Riflebacteria bacterium HGW-Riflebacteria-2]
MIRAYGGVKDMTRLAQLILVLSLITCLSGTVWAENGNSLRQLLLSRNEDSNFVKDMQKDLQAFVNRAGKLQRLCEGALKEGSYLDRISNSADITNQKQMRPAYRFWSLFYKFMSDLEKIGEIYEVPLVFNHNKKVERYYAAYVLGMSARLCRLIAAAEMMNFLAARPKLNEILNESNSEFGFAANSLANTVKSALKAENLAQLYRFRISHFEELRKLVNNAQAPDFSNMPANFILANQEFLDNLSDKVASDPSWKFLSRSIIKVSLDFVLPAQKTIFSWVGDTRIKQKKTRLITGHQIKKLGRMLEPGDIVLERQDWYLSNIFLPGFWPHAILYVGTSKELRRAFDYDPQVREWCRSQKCANFSELLKNDFPKAYKAWLSPSFKDRGTCVVIEAISEGVVFNSLASSCHGDYLAAMRPRLTPLQKAKAIHTAFSYFAREYDFNFSFNTEQTMVCTELVTKAYTHPETGGLKFPVTFALGKPGVTADAIVETFAGERGNHDRKLDFVAFVRGFPRQRKAEFASEKEFADSHNWQGGLISDNLR